MANLENLKNGKKFKKGHPPMGGRPKNVFTQYADKFQLSKTDVKNVINLVLSKNTTELEKMMKDKETSALLLAFISASITAIKKGDTRSIEYMLDRSIGKVADKLDLSADAKVRIEISKELLPKK
jgi:hypothetical protein